MNATFWLSPIWPVALTLLASLPTFGEDASQFDSVDTDSPQTSIPGPIADGTPSPIEEKPETIPFKVLTSLTQKAQVIESAEMPELPAVKGTINRTVQWVSDPALPEPPPPLPILAPEDPAVLGRLAEARAKFKATQILFVSARVIDHEKTILEVYPNGSLKDAVSVLSSIDYNDFSGFSSFQVATPENELNQYALIMAVGNENTSKMRKLATKFPLTYKNHDLPELPSQTSPAFVILEGNNEEVLQAIRDMHALYVVEGARMRESRIAREKAHEARKAYLLANPQKPEDVTIRFWKRSAPSPASQLPIEGGVR